MYTKRLLQLITNTFVVFLVSFVMLGVNNAFAQDNWYVNSTEGDDTNDGSQMDNAGAGVGPFATIDAAITAAADDDTIIILAGTYGEDIDPDASNAGIDNLTFSVQASGPNTIAYIGGDIEIDDNHAFTGGTGTFEVLAGFDLFLHDGTLTLAASYLELPAFVTVFVEDGALAGASPVYAGDAMIDYDPDDSAADVDLTTGLELPADGDLDGGFIFVDPTWTDGSLTVDQDTEADIDIDGDIDVVFSGSVTGDVDISGDGVVDFYTTIDGGTFTYSGGGESIIDGAVDLTGALTISGTVDITFNSTMDAATVDISGAAAVDFNGAASVDGGDFDHTGAGDVTTADLDLNAFNLTQTAGTFTMASTLTIGDGDAAAVRVANGAAGTMTLDNIVLENDDAAGDDGTAAFGADEVLAMTIANSGELTINGTLTEATIEDSSTGADDGFDVTYVFAFLNADDGLITFNETTTFSGNVANSSTEFDNETTVDPGVDGIAIASGKTVTAAWDAGFTDLGHWGGGTLEISKGTADIINLSEVGSFTLSAARDITTLPFVATGNVDLQADAGAHTVEFDVTGRFTVSGDGTTIDAGATDDHTFGGLNIAGTGFVLGDAGDGLDTATVDGDTNLGDGTITGNLSVDGEFQTDDGTVTGTFDVDNGDASFDGTSTVGGTVNVEGDMTIVDGATITFTGLGVGVSDVLGTLTVNGSLTLTDGPAGVIDDNPTSIPSGGATAQGVDFTLGDLTIASPDGLFAVAGVDLLLSGDFTGGVITGGDDAKVSIPSGGATFSPGPNTSFDFFSAEGSGRTVTIGEGFEVDTDGLFVQNDATVDLGDNTITVSGGDVTMEDEATITTSEPTGALAFASGGAQSIIVTGAPTTDPSLSNIRINAGSTVTVEDDIDITGDLSLNDGTFVVAALITVTMTGSSATITRNPEGGLAGGTLTVTGDLDGAWDVVYFGDGPGTTTGEFADGQTDDVTVNMTDGEAIDFNDAVDITGNFTVQDGDVTISADVSVAGNFDYQADGDGFTIDGGDTFDIDGDANFSATGTANSGDLLIAGSATIDEDVMVDGSVTFDGTGTVTLNGALIDGQTFTGDYTINGSTDDEDGADGELGAVTIDDGATVTATDIQSTLDITVTDGTFTLTMFDDDEVADDIDDNTVTGAISVDPDGVFTLNGDGEVTGITTVTVDELGSFTLGSDVETGGTVTLGTDGADDDAPALDLGGNTLTVGGDFDDDDGTAVFNSGTVDMAGGDVDVNGSTFSNLTISGASTTSSDLEISGTFDLDADLDATGDTVTLSGDAEFAADITGGEFETTGTTLTMEADVSVVDFTVNSATTTTLADDGEAGAPYDFTVGGDFTMTQGTLAIGDQELTIDGGVFDYADGTFTMDDGQVHFSGATTWDSDDNDVSLANIEVDGLITMDPDDGGDGLTVTGTANIDVSPAFDLDPVAAGDPLSTVTFGDGSTLIVGATGVLALFGADDPVLGDDMNVEYDGGVATTTGNELAAAVATFETDGTDVDLEDDRVLAVSTSITLDGTLDIDPGDDEDQFITLADGGTVTFEDGAAMDDADEPFTFAGGAAFVFQGLAATTDGLWPDAFAPTSMSLEDDGELDLHEDRTVGDVTLDDVLDVDTPGTILTVTGSLTVLDDGGFDTSEDDYVSMGGTTAQTMTFGGGEPENLEIDNAAGVTLSGSDLDMSAVGSSLILTDGALITGTNTVILAHGGTADQGYTRTDGAVFGNVMKDVDLSGAPPNRVQYPLGDADGNWRPFAITFNDPIGDVGLASVEITSTYAGSSPLGTNGLAISTTDSEGNALSIGRYPDFHWNVSSAPTISPSVDYDVEFQAEGYDNFAGEEVEQMRAIRRADGATTNFWILTSPTAGDNDNYAVSATEPVAVARNAVGAVNANGVLFTFGLESNMSATALTDVTVNVGGTDDTALAGVFSGGSESYTYAVTGGNTVATGAEAGGTLTVTGVGAGTVTLTVTATDDFGATVSTTVDVTVNAALTVDAAIADYTANAGDTATDFDVSTIFGNGTTPYAYAVVSSDAAATVALVTTTLSVTPAAAGTATITVTVTDATGATLDEAFDVTVSTAVNVAAAIADKTMTDGATADDDVSAVFADGTGTLTYTVSSSDSDVASVALVGTTLTTTAAGAYDLSGGSVADAADATVTVTATDELGGSVASTFTVTVNPVLGDLDGSGGPSAFSASLALDAFLVIGDALTTKQAVAADYDADGDIDPYDAFQIWQAATPTKRDVDALPAATLAWGEVSRTENTVTLPITVDGNISQAVSASLSARIDPALAAVQGVTTDLGDGWMVKYTVDEEGLLKIGIIGIGELTSDGIIASVSLQLVDPGAQFNMAGEGAVNNNPISNLDEVEVVVLPETFALDGNYPNPFNPTTTIQFDLPETADVEIQIYDMLGRRVMILPITTIQAGSSRTMQLDASSLASGSYFYRVIAKMESKTVVENGRMLLIK